jgi:hypothetical protein
MSAERLIWVLADDRAGNVAQSLGVAEAVGRPFVTKTLAYTPLAKLHSLFQGASPMGLTAESRMALAPPWPDLVIAAGRRTAPVARWIKRKAAKRVAIVQLMNPGRAGAGEFDLIVVPHHDCVAPDHTPANVLRITGAPHRMTAARLQAARAQWQGRLAHLPRPFIAVLVGGATHSRPFPAARARGLGVTAAHMAKAAGGTVLLATSRRTGADAEQALLEAIPEPRAAFLWSQGGDNPYAGFLALADAVVVTGDSVSMCSEACAADGPVYIFAPEGMASVKHQRLHRALYERGLARPLVPGTAFEIWRHPPLNAANEVAGAIDTLFNHTDVRGNP